jgi:hypothetical protein
MDFVIRVKPIDNPTANSASHCNPLQAAGLLNPPLDSSNFQGDDDGLS